MIIEKIHEQLEKDRKVSTQWLRPSSIGKCTRAIAYQKLVPELATPMRSRGILVFSFGDMIEKLYLDIAEKLGLVTNRQMAVSLNIAGLVINGSIDGLFDLDGVPTPLDVKSCNTRKFALIKSKGIEAIDKTYIYQANCYMKALNVKRFMFVFVNKDTCEDLELIIDYNENILKDIEIKLEILSNCDMDNLPPREYAPSEKTGNLLWQCTYCSHVTTCYPDAVLSFDSKMKPVFKVGAK